MCAQLAAISFALLAASPLVFAQGEPSADQAVVSALAAGKSDEALAALNGLLANRPADARLLRAKMHLLLGLGRDAAAKACARQLLAALPEGLERACLATFAEASPAFFRSMTTDALVQRIEELGSQGAPDRMKPAVDVLEARVLAKVVPPQRILGDFFGSDHGYFDCEKSTLHFRMCLDATNDKDTRASLYECLMQLEKGQRLTKYVAKRAVALAESPAVREVHESIDTALRAGEQALATGARNAASKALDGPLALAEKRIKALGGDDTRLADELQIALRIARGYCQEVRAHLAQHRRPQEAMQIRARTQALAIVEYERALKLNGDAPCFEKASAKAWALHRIAVLGVAIATHHEERQASYKKFGRSYPEAARITEFRTKVHGAATRLKREFPEAELEPGKPLWEVSALPTKKNAPPSPRRR